MGFPVANAASFLDEYRQACRPIKYRDGRHADIWLLAFNTEDVAALGRVPRILVPGRLPAWRGLKGDEFKW